MKKTGPGDDAFTLTEVTDHGHVSRHYRDNDAMRIRAHILRDRLRPLQFSMTWAERITPQQAREVLHGLGFRDEQIDGDVGALSGG